MRCTKKLLLVGVIFLFGGGLFLYWFVTQHSFSAREKTLAIESFIARNLRHLALPPGVRGITNPVTPTPLAIAEARDHFADHCAVCHGNNGDGKTMIGEGLYPPVPDMRKPDTQNMSDGEIFFTMKKRRAFYGHAGLGWRGCG